MEESHTDKRKRTPDTFFLLSCSWRFPCSVGGVERKDTSSPIHVAPSRGWQDLEERGKTLADSPAGTKMWRDYVNSGGVKQGSPPRCTTSKHLGGGFFALMGNIWSRIAGGGERGGVIHKTAESTTSERRSLAVESSSPLRLTDPSAMFSSRPPSAGRSISYAPKTCTSWETIVVKIDREEPHLLDLHRPREDM